MIAKIRYKYLWNISAWLRYHRLRYTRRVLWRCVGSKAVYKPYSANRGSGWSGRYEWHGRVLAYVARQSKHEVKWY